MKGKQIEKTEEPEIANILWLCGSQQTVENSEIDGNTRPLYLFHEKPTCGSIRTLQGTTDCFKIGK